MCISVKGSGVRNRAFVYEAAIWGIKHLMPRMQKTLNVDIILKCNLLSKESFYGDCIWEDSVYRPREFTMHLDSKQSKPYLIQTLMHELIHIKQFARAELKDVYNSHTLSMWKGTLYDITVTKYEDLPWEIEARAEEGVLYEKWLKQSDYKNMKWAKC
tara:strand:+ start:4036 stop:4509 length:474 start_codon:yes stop_codon:yes gene_type:complete